MTSRERVLAVLAGEKPDTVPIVPVIDGWFAPKVIGRKNDECFLDGICLADALAASLEKFGYDGAVAEMGLGPQPNVLGCPVEIEGNDVPLVVDTIVGGREDLDKVRMPDPWAGGKMEPVRRLVETGHDGDRFVIGSVRSPFEYAATVRGLIGFMTDFYADPDFVHQLIAAVKPATIAVGMALAETGVDAIVMKDSFASSSMISPDHYREFVFPYEAQAIGELKESVPVILHVCRNSMPILADMAQTGAAVLEMDSPVDLGAARPLVGAGIVLKGNIDADAVVEKGGVADIEAAVKAAMDAAKQEGGFILSTGDSVSVEAPEENVAALVRFGRQYGGYLND
ncbi:MAG: uroporphyrinogen decarboxylase family protein [Thermoleophilia bacterium]|nr:uroporphyrinogen decarboxylase family protein [Thermoleophilia bacterium]